MYIFGKVRELDILLGGLLFDHCIFIHRNDHSDYNLLMILIII